MCAVEGSNFQSNPRCHDLPFTSPYMNSDRSFYFNPSPEGVVVVVVVVALVVGCLLGNSPSDQYGVFS